MIDLTDDLGNPSGYTVKYIDDGKQGDNIANNTPHTITFNDDGTGRTSNVVGLINFQVESVPEPGTLALLLIGLISMALSAPLKAIDVKKNGC
ncbi:MAG: PEP-CTERM sorting domain-containing protein [Deltaproteobacteria bacterium]|nr:PEP-CTERM sorting domain-containing protein [Deltaproteobacteria bacterium]